MDKIVNINSFKHLSDKFNKNQFKNLRILCVFGKSSKIFVTKSDEVFGFGDNEYGCLGLGINDPIIQWPKANPYLTNKRLVDISFGYSHCIALTRCGQCWSWGHNNFGQLGDGTTDQSPKPRLIEGLADQTVVEISCGNAHNIALTASGEVYAWGRNHFGEIGDYSAEDRYCPTLLTFDCKVIAVSCGKTHSLALTERGQVYVWGSNKFGQLGHQFPNPKHYFSYRPLLLHSMTAHMITKAICGSNHSLLLTSKGQVFGFGINDFGQVGNGTKDNQLVPVRVNDKIVFRDIATCYMCHTSTGVSIDGKFYVWGLCRDGTSDKHILSPQMVRPKQSESTALPKSLFDIYANFAIFKITYKAIVVNREPIEPLNPLPAIRHKSVAEPHFPEQKIKPFEQMRQFKPLAAAASPEPEVYESDDSSNDLNRTSSIGEVSNPTKSASNESLNTKSSNILIEYFRQSFNNPMRSDIRFRINDKYIFGHKNLLIIRNEKFWQNFGKLLDNENVIQIEDYSYESFYAFIQFLYTNWVNIETEIAAELWVLANIYGEDVLKENCYRLLAKSIYSTNTKPIDKNSHESRNSIDSKAKQLSIWDKNNSKTSSAQPSNCVTKAPPGF